MAKSNSVGSGRHPQTTAESDLTVNARRPVYALPHAHARKSFIGGAGGIAGGRSREHPLNSGRIKLAPWLDKVRATKDDLGFYEVGAAYVASLNDAHSEFFVDSDFTAYLGFDVDLYDGRALVDTIDPSISRSIGFQTGDELVSVDGKTVADWLAEDGSVLSFRVRDRTGSASVPVRYTGTVPDPFRQGREVIVTVRKDGATFVGQRDSLVTKCPSKFTAKRSS